MPKTARKRSESGYYHVVSKAIADHIVFESDADRRFYIDLLDKAQADTACLLHAYCLMSNHVHLVVEDRYGGISQFMKFVTERYGTYVADKTGRTGGIFKRPFWSEPIESDEYLLCAVRYVHANPEVAGICPALSYDWSSAKDYLGRKGITYTAFILDMIGGVDGFVRFSQEIPGSAKAFPTSRLKAHLTDDEVMRVAALIVGEEELRTIGTRSPIQRNAAIRMLKDAGLTVRQIARATGVGTHVIQMA